MLSIEEIRVIIYPSQTIIRDTERSFEIDDNDPEFIREPTGLFAIYLGHESSLLLISTEIEGHWDIVTQIWAIHFEKLHRLFSAALQAYTTPIDTS
jgi:hypothetical protein